VKKVDSEGCHLYILEESCASKRVSRNGEILKIYHISNFL
jgi:hypothetical protein